VNDNHQAKLARITPSFARDTRSRLIAALVAAVGTAFIVTIEQLGWFFGLFLIVLVTFRPRRSLLKKAFVPLPVILAFGVLSFVTHPSQLVYSNGFQSASFDKTTFVIFMIAKAMLAVGFILSVVESESFYDVIYALDDLRLPWIFTSLMFLTYRNIFLIQAEFRRMLEARYNRNFGKRSNFNFYTMKVLGNMIGGVLIRSLWRSEHTADILVARGFQGRFPHPNKPWTVFGIVFATMITLGTATICLGVG